MNIIEHVINQLAKLPGLGKKSASRIVYYLLKSPDSKTESLANSLLTLKKSLKACGNCGNFSETDPCHICQNQARDRSTICVVENAKDIYTIEATHLHQGLYHVLGGVISPLSGVGPNNIRINELIARIKNTMIKEIIIATNPTVEGDTTALYLAKVLKGAGVTVTRLALGLPVGGDLEYADKLTLSQALKGRIKIE
ncbi:MAG: recombination protein RecR [Spirochaetales bacterium]|nr:recombination protein RecR [Spirochaetales bacterium]